VQGKNVDYKGLLAEKSALIAFTDVLAQKSPDSHPQEFPTENERLAYWINAYNALILKIIIENYPVESIKDINFIGFTVWLTKNTLGGKEISFKSLEDDIIRDRFKDPRIHFAINCASVGCPPLAPWAYTADKLDEQMDLQTRKFVNDTTNFYVDEQNQTIYMSSIFDWYEDDYIDWFPDQDDRIEPVLLDYIALYLDGEIAEKWRNYDLEFYDYDWSLNDTNR
jgi:hypothetical protein